MFDIQGRKNGRPLLIGHRGAMEVAPENTMVAFERGVADGADILELDVQITADNEIIVFHDIDIAGKTGGKGMIHEHTADYLQSLDVGSHFAPQFTGLEMPLLDEVLTWAKGKVGLMIELKHGPYFNPDLDKLTVALIEDHNMTDEVIIISPDQFALLRVKLLNPDITTSFMYGGRLLNPLAIGEGALLDGLSPMTQYLSKEIVDLLHEVGYFCSPGGFWWDYPALVELGVDTVTSNNPAEAIELISP